MYKGAVQLSSSHTTDQGLCIFIFSGKPPCSMTGMQHYSFDYAQQVHYPHYAQQVGPLFFKTPRKCQCFGVCAEGSGKINVHFCKLCYFDIESETLIS